MKFLFGFVMFLSIASQAAEPCQKQLELANLKSPMPISREVFAEKVQDPHENRFGQFFLAQKKNKQVHVWAMPYAGGKACVIRQIL